jgi:hypothetical protein
LGLPTWDGIATRALFLGRGILGFNLYIASKGGFMDLWTVLKQDEWGSMEVYNQASTQAEANKEAKSARQEDTEEDSRYFIAHILSEAKQNHEPIVIVPLFTPRAVSKKTKAKKR